MDGHLESKASPRIRIAIAGALSREPIEVDAIVDTGFTGSITMPIAKALPLGLILFSVTQFTLADDRKVTNFLCMGTVRFEGRASMVTIAIGDGGDVLVGTEFMDTFAAILHFDYSTKQYSIRCGTQTSSMSIR